MLKKLKRSQMLMKSCPSRSLSKQKRWKSVRGQNQRKGNPQSPERVKVPGGTVIGPDLAQSIEIRSLQRDVKADLVQKVDIIDIPPKTDTGTDDQDIKVETENEAVVKKEKEMEVGKRSPMKKLAKEEVRVKKEKEAKAGTENEVEAVVKEGTERRVRETEREVEVKREDIVKVKVGVEIEAQIERGGTVRAGVEVGTGRKDTVEVGVGRG